MTDKERQHQEGVVGVFSRAAPTYDRVGPRFFTYFGQRLVEMAQVPPGAKVLDVASGRGATLFPAAERVGPDGRVIGIDLSAEMVRETAREIRRAGWQNAEMRQMSAERLDFPDGSFDQVLCGFALWFFPEPHRSLQEFSRVLNAGGGVGLTTWQEDCPFLNWFRSELSSVLPPRESQRADRPETPRFDTPERLATALREAGFQGIQIKVEESDFIYADEEEWWSSLWSHGIRQRLEQLEEPLLEEVKREMLQRVQVLKRPDGIHTLFRALYAVGYQR